MQKLFARFRDSRLSVKIIVMFSLVLMLATGLMLALFGVEQNNARYAEFDRISQQNTQLIANNVDAMLNNASYASKMIISNASVQKILMDKRSFNTPSVMSTLRPLLSSMSNLQPNTAGIYLFNTRGQRFGMDNYTLHTFSYGWFQNAPWYEEVERRKGYYLMLLNGGENRPLYGSENVISMVRLVFNLDQQSDCIGAIMLNMRESFLLSIFSEFEETYNAEVTIVNEDGVSLFTREPKHFASLTDEQKAQLMQAGQKVVTLPVQDEGHVAYSSVMTKNTDWHVIVALPYTGDVQSAQDMRSLFGLLLMMEVLLIFIGTVVVTRMIARPLHRLTETMSLPEGARPVHVEMDCANDEIGMLKDTYNGMVDRVDELFRRIESESERKRQAEFHALQAQINPHFLYNTIDTARGLALMGRTADVNRLLRNLGEFYRNSINNGRNVITLREEIHMVRSYMDIQQIRYEDIHTAYDVDDSLCDVRIPKLVLQPLVENALYHGLRPLGNKGTIVLKVYREGDDICVSVADDGIGIDPQVIAQVFDEEADPLNRFGLQGTIDRLRLFYRRDNVLLIERETGRGTRMTILIPQDAEKGECMA